MIFFDIIMTIIEDLFIVMSINYLCKIHKKTFMTCIVVLISILESYFFSIITINSLLLYILLIVTWTIYINYMTNNKNITISVIPITLLGILGIANILSFLLVSMICDVFLHNIYLMKNLFIIAVFISRILFILFLVLIKYVIKKTNFDIFYYLLSSSEKSLTLLIFCIYMILTTLGEMLINGLRDDLRFYVLIIEFIGICFSSIYFIYELQVKYKIKMKIQKVQIQNEYSQKLYMEISRNLYNFSREKHDLFYFLTKIELLARKNNQLEIVELIQEKKYKLTSLKVEYDTDNVIFDHMINNIIKELRLENWDVLYTSNLSYKTMLNDIALLKIFEDNIQTFIKNVRTHNKKCNINIYEKNHYIILSITINEIQNTLINSDKTLNISKYSIRTKIETNENAIKLKMLVKEI